MKKKLIAVSLAGIILFSFGLCGCKEKTESPAKALTPQIVIIIAIDTLRADHLSCYGYPVQTSAAIDRFASGATLFENSISNSSWTLPSFASMFTSLYHHEHKSGMPCDQTGSEKRHFNITTLDESFTTLAEILEQEGYQTAAFTEGALMSPAFGVAQGFDLFKVCSVPKEKDGAIDPRDIFYKDIKNVVDESLSWIRDNRKNSFFLFFHTYEPHAPLRDRLGMLDQIKNLYAKKNLFNISNNTYLKNLKKTKKKQKTEIAKWLQQQKMLYDCEIFYMDRQLERFFDALKKMDLYDRSLIVFTSDHGEEFGEHGKLYHGKNLYQESIAVPLIIKKPFQKEGCRIKHVLAQGVDVLPTILDFCSIDAAAYQINRKSLFSNTASTSGMAHLYTNQNEYAATINGNLKRIHNYAEPDRCYLFNLEKDPAERNNIASSKKTRLKTFPKIVPAEVPESPSTLCFDEFATKIEETKNQLRALGYIQ